MMRTGREYDCLFEMRGFPSRGMAKSGMIEAEMERDDEDDCWANGKKIWVYERRKKNEGKGWGGCKVEEGSSCSGQMVTSKEMFYRKRR